MPYFVAVIPADLASILHSIVTTYDRIKEEEQSKLVSALESFNETFYRIAAKQEEK